MERVTGIGGVFLRARDPDALRAWYAEHLGIELSAWGTAAFDWTPGGASAFALFGPEGAEGWGPEQRAMVNFRVADLDAMLAQLRASGAEVLDAVEESEHGRFGWVVDPEGSRVELWQPPAGG